MDILELCEESVHEDKQFLLGKIVANAEPPAPSEGNIGARFGWVLQTRRVPSVSHDDGQTEELQGAYIHWAG